MSQSTSPDPGPLHDSVDPDLPDAIDVPSVPLERFGGEPNLRSRTVRGVLVNSFFQVAFAGFGILQRFGVAAFLTIEEFGVWGLVLSTLTTLSFLKQIGISDKYIQQEEADQELAFQKAFTLELVYTLIFCGLLGVLLPLYALAYGRPEILLPSLVLTLSLLGTALQVPVWIFYRRMQFVKQRLVEGINPVVAATVTMGMAIAGAGYWSLVVGTLSGAWAAGIVAVIVCPYKLRFKLDRGTLREYLRFSWPLAIAGGSALLVVQATLMIGNYTVGLAGLGAIALASTVLLYTQRVDDLIGRSIYPAICAVQDRRDLLFETFTKSNRIAIMWGLPFGLGMLLFAPDLVHYVLGDKWDPAVSLLQVMGLLLGIGQIGVSWKLFYQATGETRPLAVHAVVAMVMFALGTAPLMILFHLTGYMIGMSISFLGSLIVRAVYLRRLFSGFNPVRHLFRGIAPSVPAVASVLIVRLAYAGDRTAGMAIAELALYVVVTVAATAAFEGELVREMIGYLRRGRGQPAVATESAQGLPA